MSSTLAGGRRRITTKYSVEEQALDHIAKEAEARLAARRAARAEARDIRMRELERQQKHADEQSDRHFEMMTEPVRIRQTVTRSGSHGGSSYGGSRRSSEDSTDMESKDSRDMRHQLSDLEDKFRKAMISNAQLDNEKASLMYGVDTLKDDLEEVEENFLELQKDYKEKCRDLEFLKKDSERMKTENQTLLTQLEQREKLIEEHGLVVITTGESDDEDQTRQGEISKRSSGVLDNVTLVSQEAAHLLGQAGEGSLDVRLKRFAEEKQDLLDQIRRLKLDLDEEKQKNVKMEKLATGSPLTNGPDVKFVDIQREANKQMGDYKFKLQKAEQEVTTLQSALTRLENQLARYKVASETSEKAEDELKTEKRKLQRELREALSRVEELETANTHLQKRIDKLKSGRNAAAIVK